MKSGDPAEDVAAYATLVAHLAQPSADRSRILGARGIEEDAWEAIDDAWQARLLAEPDVVEDEDAVPPLAVAFDAAFSRAMAALAGEGAPIALARFAEAIRELQRGDDPRVALRRAGVTMREFLAAQAYWTGRVAIDPDLAATFRAIVG